MGLFPSVGGPCPTVTDRLYTSNKGGIFRDYSLGGGDYQAFQAKVGNVHQKWAQSCLGIFLTFPESFSVLAWFLSCGTLKQRFFFNNVVLLLNKGLFLYKHFGNTDYRLFFTDLLVTTLQCPSIPHTHTVLNTKLHSTLYSIVYTVLYTIL